MFADYLIRDGEFGLSFIRAANGEHTEIVEQAHKVVGVGEIEVSKSCVNIDKAVLDKKLLAQSMLYEVFEKQDSTLVSRKINIKKSNNNFNAEISYIFNENIAQTSELSVTD